MNIALLPPLPRPWSSAPPAVTARPHPWLEPGGLQRLRLASGVRLQVVSGCAWVTYSGAVEDHFLAAGDALDLPPGADLLVQADGPLPLHWRWDAPATRPGAAR
jgi:hypothetical protein